MTTITGIMEWVLENIAGFAIVIFEFIGVAIIIWSGITGFIKWLKHAGDTGVYLARGCGVIDYRVRWGSGDSAVRLDVSDEAFCDCSVRDHSVSELGHREVSRAVKCDLAGAGDQLDHLGAVIGYHRNAHRGPPRNFWRANKAT